jgi:hypothetical protein
MTSKRVPLVCWHFWRRRGRIDLLVTGDIVTGCYPCRLWVRRFEKAIIAASLEMEAHGG